MNSIIMLNGLMDLGGSVAGDAGQADEVTLTWYGDQDSTGVERTVTVANGNLRVPFKQRAKLYQLKLAATRLDNDVKVSSIGVTQVRRHRFNA